MDNIPENYREELVRRDELPVHCNNCGNTLTPFEAEMGDECFDCKNDEEM